MIFNEQDLNHIHGQCLSMFKEMEHDGSTDTLVSLLAHVADLRDQASGDAYNQLMADTCLLADCLHNHLLETGIYVPFNVALDVPHLGFGCDLAGNNISIAYFFTSKAHADQFYIPEQFADQVEMRRIDQSFNEVFRKLGLVEVDRIYLNDLEGKPAFNADFKKIQAHYL